MLDKEWQELKEKQFQERKKLLEKYARLGLSRSEGARNLGTSASQLTFLINKHKVHWPKCMNWVGGRKGYFREHYEHLANSGYSKVEAAKELGVSYAMITRAAKRYDLKFFDGRARKAESLLS
tara:strand:- start:352 stop:720 length:369 start_codon:yes stop_codon:yes gene_type:complete